MARPMIERGMKEEDIERMVSHAKDVTDFMKALTHEGRLMILCHLVTGEKSVTELEQLLSSRQSAVSQQLARLRLDGLVNCRRDGKAVYYSIKDERAKRVLDLIFELFCTEENNDS